MTLRDGEIACFHDINNEKFIIKMNSIYNLARFSSLYDTSSYNIKNEMTWNCLGSAKCWWGENCGNGYELNTLSKNTTNPFGYGCHMTSVSCSGSICTHGTSCVWYRWEIVPYGKRYPVYSLYSQTWETSITITYKGVSREIKINTNNPKHDLNDILNNIMDHMPITVTAMDYEKINIRESIIEKDGKYYNIMASPHNMPIKGLVGDIQFEKKGPKAIFYTNTIDCSTDSCTVKCNIEDSAVNRLEIKSPYAIDDGNIEKLSIYDQYWINYKYRVTGHATITFGNVELKELIVEKPHCVLDVAISYACEACLEQPTATIVSKEVSTEGSLQYESNCTFDVSTLACNIEMYEIKQISKNKYCNIYIPLLNQSLSITFDYEYRGKLTDMKVLRAETSMDIMAGMFRDSNFLVTLMSSLSSFLLLTGLATFMIKLTRLGVLAFGRKEVQQS